MSDEELALGKGHQHLADGLRRSPDPEIHAGATEGVEHVEGGPRPDDARSRQGGGGCVPELLVETASLDELLAAMGIDHAGDEPTPDARQVSEAHEQVSP